MADVDTGKVNCIVTKDLSRFGREHVMMDYYLEFVFPEKQIALNTGKAAADLSVNNPVYIMGSGFMIFGLVLLAAGIVLAIVLKRKSRT